MNKALALILLSVAAVVSATAAVTAATPAAAGAPAWPYDEKADAGADIRQALAAAQTDHRRVLLVFGANWCEDCRDLDKAMKGSSRTLITGRFDVVKIDVGNFNKNLDIAKRYGNPIEKGIPAVVIVDGADKVLYSTRGGELADARKMGDKGIYEFLERKLSGARD